MKKSAITGVLLMLKLDTGDVGTTSYQRFITHVILLSGKVLCVEIKWNESGFRPPLCTYRLNWAGRTSWGWWDEWDDTVLQTQDSKFRNSNPGGLRPSTLPFGHGGSHNTEFHTWMWKKHFCFFQTAESGNRTPDSSVKGSIANHYPRAPARFVLFIWIIL